jgi:hypothetical protein
MPHASPIRAGSRVFQQLGTTLRTSRPYNRDLGLARSAERDAVFVRRHPLVERLAPLRRVASLNFAQAALQFEVSGVGGAVTGPGGAPSKRFGTSDRAIKGVIRSTARSWAVG